MRLSDEAVAIARTPVAAIARAMGLARQSVQRTADLLEAEGLVEYVENPAHRAGQVGAADFAQAIQKADRIPPALLVISIITAVGFALSGSAPARALALMGAAGFVVALIASGRAGFAALSFTLVAAAVVV